jgi:uncharacterized Zn-binding protein involved in type VI secretion
MGTLMAWTQSDLDALDKAIASGEKQVMIDGKMIVYQGIDDMQRRRQMLAAYLAGSGTSTAASPRHKLASFADTDTP